MVYTQRQAWIEAQGNEGGSDFDSFDNMCTTDMGLTGAGHSCGFPDPRTSSPHPKLDQNLTLALNVPSQAHTHPSDHDLRFEIERLSDDTGFTHEQLKDVWTLIRHKDILLVSFHLSIEDVRRRLNILRNEKVFLAFRRLLYPRGTASQYSAQTAAVPPRQSHCTVPHLDTPGHKIPRTMTNQVEVSGRQAPQFVTSQGIETLNMEAAEDKYQSLVQSQTYEAPDSSHPSSATVVHDQIKKSLISTFSQGQSVAPALSRSNSLSHRSPENSFNTNGGSAGDCATPASTPALSFTTRSPASNNTTPWSNPATPPVFSQSPSVSFGSFDSFQSPSPIVTPRSHPAGMRAGPVRTSTSSKRQKFSSKNQRNRQLNYQCSYCGHFFQTLPPLYTHEAEQHDAKFSYECQHADCSHTQCETALGMRRHHKKAHINCGLAECEKLSRLLIRGYKQACACGVCGKLIDLSDYKPLSSDWVTRNDTREATHRKNFLIDRYHNHLNTHRAELEDESVEKQSWMQHNWQRALVAEAFLTENEYLKIAWDADCGVKSALCETWDTLSSPAWDRIVELFEFSDHSSEGAAKQTIKLVRRCLEACGNGPRQEQVLSEAESALSAPRLESSFPSQRDSKDNDHMEGVLSASSHTRHHVKAAGEQTWDDQIKVMLSDACSRRSSTPPNLAEETNDSQLTTSFGASSDTSVETTSSSDTTLSYAADDENTSTVWPGAYLLNPVRRFER